MGERSQVSTDLSVHRLILLSLLLATTSVAASGMLAPVSLLGQRTLEIESFHADIQVRANGNLDVTETIRVRFIGSWNGVLRQIPVEYSTGYGANYTLRLSVEGARSEAGDELRYESERAGRNRVFRIYVPGANDATRTVVFRYTVANGLRFFEEHDELYWNVTGNDSEYPILAASARVTLPTGISGLRTSAFSGPAGSTQGDVQILETGNEVDFRVNRSLAFREGLTIVVGWNPGSVARPGLLQRLRGFLISNFLLVIPLMVATAMFLAWRRFGRDPQLRSLMPEYEPPEGLTPAEAGTLIDTTPDLRDVTATIVDLAVRGFLVIEESEKKILFGLISSESFTFRVSAPRERWAELKAFEFSLMTALFADRDEVDTSELENSFYQDLPGIKSKLNRTLVRDGHYMRHPNHVRLVFLVIGVVAAALIVVVGSILLEEVLGQQPTIAVVSGIATGFVIAGFGIIMPARTNRGTRVLERLLGFEEFLRRVESDRFERVIRTPEMFETFLPYAMAFGVEKNWASAFAEIYRSAPEWYRGRDFRGFHTSSFSNRLSRMSSVTGAAMTTAPRSSSGSSGFGGGGGGGFSGGGFGGGGVGGF